jgi:ABC-type Fe3+/spermidine/putrescine transport system ATPase subunit
VHSSTGKVHTVGRKKKSLMDRELEVLSARVRFEVYREVERIAKKEGLTLTQVVRRAVNEYVVKMKEPRAAA